ncbi:hypothetical protein CSQ80_01415 [Cyanobacterium aponinum IPPAS B-1201]|nr:hypothetical protein CSQ80_01415 [Cyanobacterium aponinum IPPAS B-1201]
MDCPRNKDKNISILGALSLDGLIGSMTVMGSTDTKVFERWCVEKILVPQLWQGAIVLMDNLSVHKGRKIKELIDSVGATLVFFPAYLKCQKRTPVAFDKKEIHYKSFSPDERKELGDEFLTNQKKCL